MRTDPDRPAQPPTDGALPSAASASAEAVFLDWLLWLPPGREPCQAARDELARIDRHPRPLPPTLRRLRALFAETLGTDSLPLTGRSLSR